MQFHPIIVRLSYVNAAASDVSGRRARLRTRIHGFSHAKSGRFKAARRDREEQIDVFDRDAAGGWNRIDIFS